MGRGKCIVCADIRDIPTDAVPLVSFGGRKGGKGGSWEYENLHRLCKADELRHWKFTRGRTGQLFVMPDEARQALDDLRDRKSRTDVPVNSGTDRVLLKAEIESACGSLFGIASTLVEIRCVLERLADAVEQVATQPKHEMQMINGNQAPWSET